MSTAPVLWRVLFLPFAAGYFLSYLYRTANGVIGPVLARELALGDADLGLLTSVYFLAFGAAQIPLGVALDRFGPRRVEATLLLAATAGAATFGLADGLAGLTLGRALIGLGVSACLMASFKAFSQWYPPERQASLTGWVMSAGGLGALAAALPMEWALAVTGWRQIFFVLAGLTLAVAGVLWFIAPGKGDGPGHESFARAIAGVGGIFRSRHYWRFAPLGVLFTGGFMAVQGLWATRWMMSVEGLTRAEAATRLTGMSAAMLGGFVFLGFFSARLAHHGVRPDSLYRTAMSLAAAMLALITLAPGVGGALPWIVLAACFSLSNVAFALVAQGFPLSHTGRANTALNLMMFAGAFGLQWGLGALVEGFTAAGATPRAAFVSTFGCLLGAQTLALAWFFWSGRRAAPGG